MFDPYTSILLCRSNCSAGVMEMGRELHDDGVAHDADRRLARRGVSERPPHGRLAAAAAARVDSWVFSCPLTTFFATWHIPPGSGRTSGSNIFDIIPVVWVANLVLLHAISGTRGIVHAGAESYMPVTFDELVAGGRVAVSDEVRKMLPPFNFVSSLRSMFLVCYDLLMGGQVQDASVEECLAAKFFKIGTRDWRFSNRASAPLRSIGGPLSIAVGDHDPIDQIGNIISRVLLSWKKRKERNKPE